MSIDKELEEKFKELPINKFVFAMATLLDKNYRDSGEFVISCTFRSDVVELLDSNPGNSHSYTQIKANSHQTRVGFMIISCSRLIAPFLTYREESMTEEQLYKFVAVRLQEFLSSIQEELMKEEEI